MSCLEWNYPSQDWCSTLGMSKRALTHIPRVTISFCLLLSVCQWLPNLCINFFLTAICAGQNHSWTNSTYICSKLWSSPINTKHIFLGNKRNKETANHPYYLCTVIPYKQHWTVLSHDSWMLSLVWFCQWQVKHAIDPLFII